MEPMSYAPWIAGSAAPDLSPPPEVDQEHGAAARPQRRATHLSVLPTPVSAPSAERAEAGMRWSGASVRGSETPRPLRLREDDVAAAEGRWQAEDARPVAALLGSPEVLLDLAVRVLGAVVIALALISAGLVLGKALAPAPAAVVTVMPGDTLYSIASGIEDAPSIGTAIEDLRDLNVLGSERLSVGQKLLLPEY